MNTQDWFPLWWAGWISLVSKGLSKVFSNTTVQKHQFFGAQPSIWFNSHIWRLLRVSWTERRSNKSILNEINPEYSLEGLMLMLQYFGHLMQRDDSLEKTLMLGKIEGRRRRGRQVEWHHWLNRCEFEQTLGDGEGQGSLVCCSPWGRGESDMTWRLNNNNNKWVSQGFRI